MPTRKEASKYRQDFIRKREEAINSRINILQENLYDNVIEAFLNQAKQNGLTKNSSAQDISSLLGLERAIKKGYLNGFPEIMRETVNAARSLGDLNQMYFSTLVDSNRLDEIRDKTKKILDKRLGLDENGKVLEKGFVNRVISNKTVQKRFIKQVQVLASKNLSVSEFQNGLKNIIVSSPGKQGIVQQHYNTFASTLLSNIDRSNSQVYADELELNHFIFGGGLIKTSRCFCIKCNGKIFTRDQADKWALILNQPCGPVWDEVRDGKYIPTENMGGLGCLHVPDWITEELAVGNTRKHNKKAAERNKNFVDKNIK